MFNFDQPFEIHDDIEVLKRLGLSYGLEKGQVDPVHHDAIRRCLPNALREYANQIIEGNLCGGVVSQAAKGPQTVTIPIGQTGQKYDCNCGTSFEGRDQKRLLGKSIFEI